MKYDKKFTVKEWNKFKNINNAEIIGNSLQFFNFSSQKHESYDYITGQEVLLQKYNIILTDHKTKSEKVKIILKKINITNFHKGMMKFNKGMSQFNNTMNQINDVIDNKSKQSTKKKRRSNKYDFF